MKIGFIGAGRVGCALGKYFKEQEMGFTLMGYCSKSSTSSREASEMTGSRAYETAEELLSECEAVFVTTGDDVIASVWQELCDCKISLKDKIFVNCSGAIASDVFADAESRGATRISLHPFLAVPDRWECYRAFGDALFTIEGSGARFEEFHDILLSGGLTLQRLAADKKIKYHAAACVASNLIVGLSEVAISLLEECGLNPTYARLALRPLMQGNLEAVMEKGTMEALTGPAERADVKTVERHLQALCGEDREIYRLLTKRITGLAKKKNPGRDYAQLDEILQRRLRRDLC